MEEPDSLPEEAEPPRGLTLALTSLSGHILGMAVCGAGGAWLVMKALDAPGPTWSRVAFGGAGVLLAVGGVGLGVGGIRRFVRWMRSDEYGRNLEQRARKLGLPTEPEAYGQGKWVPLRVGENATEAHVMVAVLEQHGIPAVTDIPPVYGSVSEAYAGGARIMVPEALLPDAQALFESHAASDAAPPPGEDGTAAARILAFVAAVVLFGLAAWVGGIAFTMTGPVGTAVVLFILALLLVGGGLVLAVMAVLGNSHAPRGEAGLEWTAERRGLPTDPEAYQDGGLAVALTTTTVPEADAAAAYLNARGVPAWVDQGYASTTLSHLQYAMNPSGVRVMVPLGRLGDARQALIEREPVSEEREEGKDEVKQPSPKRLLAKRAVSAMLIPMGIVMLVIGWNAIEDLAAGGGRSVSAVATAIWGVFGLGLCGVGVRGLFRR